VRRGHGARIASGYPTSVRMSAVGGAGKVDRTDSQRARCRGQSSCAFCGMARQLMTQLGSGVCITAYQQLEADRLM
jgi:hypothetical protein